MARKPDDATRFQHAKAGGRSPAKFDLSAISPADKPFSHGDKEQDKAAVDLLATELDELQNRLYADRRFSVLVVLQGTDTSGKDGTLRGVFGKMSPLGVKTVGWKAPNDEERSHDYLWRIHKQMPAAGDIMVFNRSHYEDVLVPPVNGWITPAQTKQRYAQINDFERALTENNTVICKFMLHISKREQRDRLQERLDDPTKHWKFAVDDLAARKKWSAYQSAYANLISATGTPWAPWTVVPADSKTHRNLMIATVLKKKLETLGLRYPAGDPALEGMKVV